MDVTRELVYGRSITGVYKVHWGTLWVVPGYDYSADKRFR